MNSKQVAQVNRLVRLSGSKLDEKAIQMVRIQRRNGKVVVRTQDDYEAALADAAATILTQRNGGNHG